MKKTLGVILILVFILSSCSYTTSDKTTGTTTTSEESYATGECKPLTLDVKYNSSDPMQYVNDLFEQIDKLKTGDYYYGYTYITTLTDESGNPSEVVRTNYMNMDCESYGLWMEQSYEQISENPEYSGDNTMYRVTDDSAEFYTFEWGEGRPDSLSGEYEMTPDSNYLFNKSNINFVLNNLDAIRDGINETNNYENENDYIVYNGKFTTDDGELVPFNILIAKESGLLNFNFNVNLRQSENVNSAQTLNIDIFLDRNDIDSYAEEISSIIDRYND